MSKQVSDRKRILGPFSLTKQRSSSPAFKIPSPLQLRVRIFMVEEARGGGGCKELPPIAFWETLEPSEQIACFLRCEGSKEKDKERLPKG